VPRFIGGERGEGWQARPRMLARTQRNDSVGPGLAAANMITCPPETLEGAVGAVNGAEECARGSLPGARRALNARAEIARGGVEGRTQSHSV
jgi:hypothetical protein